MTDGQQTAIIITSLACTTMVLITIVRAVVQRFGPRPGTDHLSDEIGQIQDRLAELNAVALRMHELEDRLDFAERLLANRPDSAVLPLHRTPA